MRLRQWLILLAFLLPRPAAAEAGSAVPVEDLDRGLLAVMRAGKARPFDQRAQSLAPVIQRAFDLPAILRTSVGPRFATLPPESRTELLDVFTRFTVASYVANFATYGGERFEILPGTRHAGVDDVVQTRLVAPGSDPILLDYVVRQSAGEWRIVDVLMNGTISRVAVQRSDFRSLLVGGDARPLIASLQGKVARLAAGETE